VFNGTGTTTSTLTTKTSTMRSWAALFSLASNRRGAADRKRELWSCSQRTSGLLQCQPDASAGERKRVDRSNVAAISCVDSLGGLTVGALTGGGTGERERDSQRERKWQSQPELHGYRWHE